MILKIVTEGDPVLRETAKEVAKITKRVKKLVKDMIDTMYSANGVGLAAPQIGVSERIVVIDVGKGPIVLINPEITSTKGEEKDTEGCLSIPGRSEYVTRAVHATVSARNLDGDLVSIEGSGLLARAFQHEIDHLNGILFIDYLNK